MSIANHSLRAGTRSLRVLIVDDEHVVADSLALILNKSGYDALAVYSGLEAVEGMATFRPQIVLSDVTMPGLNGFDLASHLAETYPTCKVLLMSGNAAMVAIAEQGLQKGHFLNVLTKPVRPQAILDFLAQCAPDPVGS